MSANGPATVDGEHHQIHRVDSFVTFSQERQIRDLYLQEIADGAAAATISTMTRAAVLEVQGSPHVRLASQCRISAGQSPKDYKARQSESHVFLLFRRTRAPVAVSIAYLLFVR
jgi:hypothetical protein